MCFRSGNSVFRRLLFCHQCFSLDAKVAALGVGIAAFTLAAGLQLQLCSDSLRKGIVVREAVRVALIQGIFLVIGVHILGENVVIVVLGAYITSRKEEVQRLAGAAADCRGRHIAVIAFALFGVAEFVVVVLECLVRQNQLSHNGCLLTLQLVHQYLKGLCIVGQSVFERDHKLTHIKCRIRHLRGNVVVGGVDDVCTALERDTAVFALRKQKVRVVDKLSGAIDDALKTISVSDCIGRFYSCGYIHLLSIFCVNAIDTKCL